MNRIKYEVQSLDGCLAQFGSCRRIILPMLYWKKKLKMLVLKSFGMEDVKAVFDAYPHDGDMTKKPNKVLFQLGRQISIRKKGRAEYLMGQMEMMYESVNMAIYSMEITKYKLSGHLVALQTGCSSLFSKNDNITKMKLNKVSIHQVSSSSIIMLREMSMWPTVQHLMLHSMPNQHAPFKLHFLWKFFFQTNEGKG